MQKPSLFTAWYAGERLGIFDTVDQAQVAIKTHSAYRKSLFTRRGEPTAANPDPARFAIYDNNGDGWTL